MVDVRDGTTGVRVTPVTQAAIDHRLLLITALMQHSSQKTLLLLQSGTLGSFDEAVAMRAGSCLFAAPGCRTGSCDDTSGRQSQPGFPAH